MTFQITPLPREDFAHLFGLSDAELSQHNAVRKTVTAKPGTPCRISMTDAEIGETVLLVNYEHQPEESPYRASHAVFVSENANPAQIEPGDVPEVLASRLISLRCFSGDHMMISADVVDGEDLSEAITTAFANAEVAYIHLHNAKPGCFAASVHRAA
ncbi:MAG: DUF1203 domain-containing protein [Pseudomonadota bacterium]